MVCSRLSQKNVRTAAAAVAVMGAAALTAAPAARADVQAAAPGAPVAKADAFVAAALRQSAPKSGWTPVIVRIKSGNHGGNEGELTAAQVKEITGLGGYVYRRLPVLASAAIRVPTRNLLRLAALPWVAHVSSDAPVVKNDEFTVEHSGADVAFAQHNLAGDGVTVAVLDSGVKMGDDLKVAANSPVPPPPVPGQIAPPKDTRLYASVSFALRPDGNLATAEDECGHGTHVSGIIAGNGKGSTGDRYFRTFYGVARRSRIVNVRVLDKQGRGTVSGVLSGLQWVLANRAKYNIRVINLSLGHPVGESYTTDPLCQAVEKVWKAGVVVVCAAGNDGRVQTAQNPALDNEGYGTAYGSVQSPANSPYVITVGAMKMSLNNAGRGYDKIATYSSRGPSRLDFVLKPDIVAPGNKIISLNRDNGYLDLSFGETNRVLKAEFDRDKLDSTDISNRYFRLSGTSMAAPVVAGAAALLLQKDPTLTPDTIKARLMLSADKWTQPDGSADPCTFGAGYLNVAAALANTFVPAQAALSPVLTRDAQGNTLLYPDSTLDASRALWGSFDTLDGLRAIWGSRALWGSGTGNVDLSRALWGSTALTDANRALWGSTVWGDRALWGSNADAVDLSSVVINGE